MFIDKHLFLVFLLVILAVPFVVIGLLSYFHLIIWLLFDGI